MAVAAAVIDAYCPACKSVRKFTVVDAGSCKCNQCGHVEQMLRPLDQSSQLSP